MDRYLLAKLIQWAGHDGVSGRKRLQKVVFFLQQAGLQTGAEYTLHHYGPYSRDVAETCDELVSSGLVSEKAEHNPVGVQYGYALTSRGESAIEQTEHRVPRCVATTNAYKSLAEELLRRELWELELGSTILFFRGKANDWTEATRRACEFKRVPPADATVMAAESVAKKVHRFRASTND